MQRLPSVTPAQAQGRTRELFDVLEQNFGMVPNAAQVMANSPAVLESFLAFATAMSGVRIGEKLLTQVRLNTSQNNDCEYCTSSLAASGAAAGLTADDILAGRTGNAEEHRTKAALTFAHDVLESRGQVSDAQLAAVRQAGYSDGEIVEIVAGVVLGCFTNFLNNTAETQLDIPAVEPLEEAATCSSGACATH